ncbi:hypothetical protein ABT158_42110 [Nonomuraea sp. NPDC001636]|uniref:hypothetical protein n=1 Tax=Nonomuraea sp. NPDC001636 TaxID=3154391 RepID=UPI00332CBFEF
MRFAATLTRLMRCRQLDLRSLSQLARIPEPDLLAITRGSAPGRAQLRQLAAALDMHAADLFLVASVPLEDDMPPRDRRAGMELPRLVNHAAHLPAELRGQLRERAHEMRNAPGAGSPPPEPTHLRYQPGDGALLGEMLETRNLDWTAAAKVLLVMTGLYLSAATIGAVARGRIALTPELAAGFGVVLGFSVEEVAALTERDIPAIHRRSPVAGMAELIWDVRRLTQGQVKYLGDVAESMRRDHGT